MSDKDAQAADESQSPIKPTPGLGTPGDGTTAAATPPREDAISGKSGAPANRASAREGDRTLGVDLAAARERHGYSRDEVARDTHIPAHYVHMIESDDYSKIADQLYMLPFVRRYAAYLEMDQDEVAMRFVREVQRADNHPAPRLDHPLDVVARKRSRVSGAIVVIAFVVIIAGLYFYLSPRHGQAADVANPGVPDRSAVTPAATGQMSAPGGMQP